MRWNGDIALCTTVFLATTAATTYSLTTIVHYDFSPALLVGSSFFTAAMWLYKLKGRRRSQAVLGLLTLLFFPLYGALFSSSLLLWGALYPPPDEAKGEAGLEDVRLFRLREPAQIQQRLEEESFIPAVTLLKSKDISERRAAIEVLAKIGGPEQIKHLQACLDDDEREIYQLAHAKLTNLHERYTDEVRAAQLQADHHEVLERLTAYLNSGLLGEATRKFYRDQAISTAKNLLAEESKDAQLHITLGELYLEAELEAQADFAFQKALELDADSLQAHWGLAQIRYKQRDFDKLKGHFRALQRLATPEKTLSLDKGMLDVMTWWFGEHQ